MRREMMWHEVMLWRTGPDWGEKCIGEPRVMLKGWMHELSFVT